MLPARPSQILMKSCVYKRLIIRLALSCVLVTLWPIEIDKNQIFTFLVTIFMASHGHLGLVTSLLVLGLLGRFKCLTSPFLSLLSLFFQLPISFHDHPVQHHLSWASS